MRTYRVDVQRGDRWWVLSVPDVEGAHSQARHLREVEATARDLIALMLEVPADSFGIDVRVQVPRDVQGELTEADRLRREAARKQSLAAWHQRVAVRMLRGRGIPYRDVGQMLGISGQRAKQLDAEAERLVDA